MANRLVVRTIDCTHEPIEAKVQVSFDGLMPVPMTAAANPPSKGTFEIRLPEWAKTLHITATEGSSTFWDIDAAIIIDVDLAGRARVRSKSHQCTGPRAMGDLPVWAEVARRTKGKGLAS